MSADTRVVRVDDLDQFEFFARAGEPEGKNEA